jgi:hypothetical protein
MVKCRGGKTGQGRKEGGRGREREREGEERDR